MDPKDVTQRLVRLMLEHTRNHECVEVALDPVSAMLGGAALIDPGVDEVLVRVGVPGVTTCIERVASLGYVSTVCPISTGWLAFAPSRTFYDLAQGASAELLTRQVVLALFPNAVPVPTGASLAVDTLRADFERLGSWIDASLIDELLWELSAVSAARCRNAAIAICGKLLEILLSTILLRWGVAINDRMTLGDLVQRLQARANERAPDDARREQARTLLEAKAARAVGVCEIAEIIRIHRNGAVHAPRVLDATLPRVQPSAEQTDAVVLLTVDLLRRYGIPDAIAAGPNAAGVGA